MKKSSTAATRSNKNLHGKLTIGLDLGDRSPVGIACWMKLGK
jgi:hypothetical protein